MKTSAIIGFSVQQGDIFTDTGFSYHPEKDDVICPCNLSIDPVVRIALKYPATMIEIYEASIESRVGNGSVTSILTFDSKGKFKKAYPVVNSSSGIPEATQIYFGESLPFPSPPPDVHFSSIKVRNGIAYGLTSKGQLLCSTTTTKTYTISSPSWSMCGPFASKEGIVESTLGKGRVKEFHVLNNRCLVILDNGAVFGYGALETYGLLKPTLPLPQRPSFSSETPTSSTSSPSPMDSQTPQMSSSSSVSSSSSPPPPSSISSLSTPFHSMPSVVPDKLPPFGCMELTDPVIFPTPLFVSEFCRKIEQASGKYGLFGLHKIVRYFPSARAFISDEGLVFLDTVHYDGNINPNIESPARRFVTVVDPELFGGEKICDVHFDGMFVFKSTTNKLFLTRTVNDPPLFFRRERGSTDPPMEIHMYYNEGREFLRALHAAVLCEPMRVRQFPFSDEEVKETVLVGGYFFVLMNDGRVNCINLEKQFCQDITPFIFASEPKPSIESMSTPLSSLTDSSSSPTNSMIPADPTSPAMKFSRQLSFIQVPKWRQYYINYRGLKKSMKHIFGPYLNPRLIPPKDQGESEVSPITLPRIKSNSKFANADSKKLFPNNQSILDFQAAPAIEGSSSSSNSADNDSLQMQSLNESKPSPEISILQPIIVTSEDSDDNSSKEVPDAIPPTKFQDLSKKDEMETMQSFPPLCSTESPEASSSSSDQLPIENESASSSSSSSSSSTDSISGDPPESPQVTQITSTKAFSISAQTASSPNLLSNKSPTAVPLSPSSSSMQSSLSSSPLSMSASSLSPQIMMIAMPGTSAKVKPLNKLVEEWAALYEVELTKVVSFVKEEYTSVYNSITKIERKTDALLVTQGAAVELKRDFLDLSVEVTELMHFIHVNSEGFRKILKKFAKVVSVDDSEGNIQSRVGSEKQKMEDATAHVMKGLPDMLATVTRIEELYISTFSHGRFAGGGVEEKRLEIEKMKPNERERLQMELLNEIKMSTEAQIAWKKNTILGEYVTHQQRAQLPGMLQGVGAAESGPVRRGALMAGDEMRQDRAIRTGDDLEDNEAKKRAQKEEMNADHFPVKWIPVVISLVILIVFWVVPWSEAIYQEMRCLGLLLYAACQWVFEAIPSYCTALSIPIFGTFMAITGNGEDPTEDAKNIIKSTMSNTPWLAIGGFTIALAMKHTALDVKLASFILSFKVTRNPYVFMVLVFLIEFLLTIVISNISSTVLVMSIILPVLREVPARGGFSKALLLGIAMCGNIAGMTSPLASPQSMIGFEQVEMVVPNTRVSFGTWVLVAVPAALVICAIGYVVLIFMHRLDIKEVPYTPVKLRFLNWRQFVVAFVSVGTIICWFILPDVRQLGNEAVIALIPFVVFFGFNLCKRSDLRELPWNMILLVMGGSALGEVIKQSHLLEMIAGWFSGAFSTWALWVKSIVLTLVVEVVAIIVSHTVSAIVFLPIIAQIMMVSGGHVELIVMSCSLIISGPMILSIASFPNMCTSAIEDNHRIPYLKSSDFLKFGTIVSVIAFVIVNSISFGIGYALKF
ncbi:putative Divalent Anion:Na+ Symporter (DASS) Family Protein [Monocercomonoides exilis]|uniref:putative Divalent Anion:Na+ Symporter (DASS) Family Protein n=1 Tax=Monocercomonoides exilis TaxID=2049356 RepID=UPI0035597712|nr:putative Divalent Anion:Na+ Symporter (DASS) Family Protein [Monocercomonoides exilis]|eukprot:MONOS_3028.1-p1 / transcript=MONOS_3028.1 / gene=MONOS_3028 / organism=Monocercomonoides_exilis_PA203 / gene_product=Divalent Anion:Na+ Symporter (DASS) Family Protein / transcript_product=Divalent Anion:Na+ Symporter (DASS) Family Protein / location=Mono_scaffold00067:62947-69212(-) / protein_length=1538 / sequence_SO=supercontig / SO=protein_coding / is_pseudo=false